MHQQRENVGNVFFPSRRGKYMLVMPSSKSIIQQKTDVREDLSASCANEQPCATNPPALGIGPLSRRRFIGRVGGATAAAWTASAIGLSPLLGSKSVKAEAATILGRQRAVENYWMALLRDVPFTDYATNATALQACAELTSLCGFQGPRINGQVTPQTLFCGFTAGDVVGPYVSQFLLQPVYFGALPMAQLYMTYATGLDYMTDAGSWLAVQNGAGPFGSNVPDSQQRYLHDGRGVSAFVHVDLLFQAYFMGLLWLLSNANFNVGNPYNTSQTQIGFGTFGGPHITGLLAEVSGYALRAQWFQKYWVHRALRPEAYGGLVHYTKTAAASHPVHSDVLNSQALAGIFAKNNGTYFLPVAFPEGSPTHPSYGSGHATVAGACVTVLKAFFNTDNVAFPNPMISAPDGLSLTSYSGADAGQITLTGELNKLASNIAQARNIAGLHWRSDATQAMLLGETVAISILRDQRHTYN